MEPDIEISGGLCQKAAKMDEARDHEQLVTWLRAVGERKDRAAFEGLYRYFAQRIKAYAARQGADAASADDLAQETMVQIWRKSAQYDASRAMPAAWVYRIARNLLIDRLRRHKHHEVELTPETDRPENGADGHERAVDRIDAERLWLLLAGLPGEQLAVIRLAFFDGMSHAEIGKELDIPLGTVKSRLRLAFGKLRNAMGDHR